MSTEKRFIDFFKKRGYHTEINNRVVNPLAKNVMFINSGVAGVYHLMMDNSLTEQTKWANIQRCIRVTGKHNDISEIGYSQTHLTSFNMLGVFTFRKTDVEQTINDLVSFIEQCFPEENIIVTVHPDHKQGVDFANDLVNKNKKYKIKQDKENTWQLDKENSPFGYCIEFFVKDIEIFNIVVIDGAIKNGVYEDTEYTKIDAGGGKERIDVLLENVNSVFHLKHFDQFFTEITRIIGKEMSFCDSEQIRRDPSIRIILDHLLTVDSMIGSSVPVLNNKRGYVLKMFLRRIIAEIKKHNCLSWQSFIHCAAYMLPNRLFLEILLKEENEAFEICCSEFQKYIDQNKKDKITKQDLFILHDRHGIHIEISTLLAKEKGIKIEQEEEGTEQVYLKNEAVENISKNEKDKNILILQEIARKTKLSGRFCYEQGLEVVLKDWEIWNEIAEQTMVVDQSRTYYFVADNIPIFPKQGGQDHDYGVIKLHKHFDAAGETTVFYIQNVHKVFDKIILECSGVFGFQLNFQNELRVCVEKERRQKLSALHTIHHIICGVMRKKVPYGLWQISSNITVDGAKFVLYHYEQQLNITKKRVDKIKQEVEDIISDSLEITSKETQWTQCCDTVEKSPFENYSSTVRVVSIKSKNINFEELCCGTHCSEALYVHKLQDIQIRQHKNKIIISFSITKK